ncbi:MAG TPA: MauE/DoxX family redox-associated membrane protein [Acidimicrobiales bacterium]|nr:MauE/DoxX family redox-associated membrane protein [Acidimicrobiales bacterium]
MNEVLYAGAVVLAAVFAWAGAAKAVAPQRTQRTFAQLGLPSVLARVVPVVELALGAGLVLAPGITAWAALAMLVAFTGLLTKVVVRGESVACGCFGSARPEPVSFVDLVRNALLIVVATAVAIGGTSPDSPGLAAVIAASGLAATGLVVVALADLKRRTGAVLRLELP